MATFQNADYEAEGKAHFYLGLKALKQAADLAVQSENYVKAVELYKIITSAYESGVVEPNLHPTASTMETKTETSIQISRSSRFATIW